MLPMDADILATCRRRDAHRAAARHRLNTPRSIPRARLRVRAGHHLVAWGERLKQAPPSLPPTVQTGNSA